MQAHKLIIMLQPYTLAQKSLTFSLLHIEMFSEI